MGKTSLVTNICFNVARDLKRRSEEGEKVGVVAIFSLEMSEEQLTTRILCEQAEVPSWKVRRGKQSREEMDRIEDARRLLGRLPLHINAEGAKTIQQLIMDARALAKRRGLALIAVDYLQLLAGGGKRNDNRNQELTEISGGLKALAKELNVPVIALSQLSRQVDARDDKRPLMSDLRESGAIEQDADTVAFVYRDEYYLGKPPEQGTEKRYAYDRKLNRVKGVAEIILPKNRHGPSGTVELGFNHELMKFKNEPDPRDDMLEPVDSTRGQPLRLPPDSLRILPELKKLEMMEPVLGPKPEGVPPWVERPVEYAKWKERCCGMYLDGERTEGEKKSFMEKAVKPLMQHQFIQRDEKTWRYVWLTERGRKACPD